MKSINIFHIFFKEFVNNKPILYVSLFTLLSYVILQLVFPSSSAMLFDNLDNMNMGIIIKITIPLVIAFILMNVSDKIFAENTVLLDTNVINTTLKQLLDSLKQNPQNNIDKLQIITNLLKLLEFKTIIGILLTHMLPVLIITIGLYYYLSKINTKVALCTIGGLILLLLVLFFSMKKNMELSQNRDKKQGEYNSELNDIITNIESVLMTNNEKFEGERLEKVRDNIKGAFINSDNKNANTKGTIVLITIVILFVVCNSLIKFYDDGLVSKGMLVSLFYLLLSLVTYYENAAQELGVLMFHLGNIKEAGKFFSKFSLEKANVNTNLIIKEGVIEFGSITMSIKDKQIFNNFSKTIKANNITGIKGKIGTGKSTLLKILLGYYDYQGEILIDGQNIKDIDKNILRREISYIPQHPIFFNRTLKENILYGTNINDDELNNIITKYNLTDFINKFPEKLDTKVVNNGENLSGGQKQILFLLKIIIQDKKIILMDEPTSSLDDYHTNLFINIIKLLKNKTIVIVSHDQQIDKIFNEIITL